MRVADMRDPAADRYEAPCPDCDGTGGERDERCHTVAECGRCEGSGSCSVDAREVVTVGCAPCLGTGERWPVGSHYSAGPRTCPKCGGDGELTGPAEGVCT